MENNITQYCNHDDSYKMYYAHISLGDKLLVMRRDERYNKLIGVRECLPFNRIIHPDDEQVLFDALEKVNVEPQHILLRVLCADDTYRMMYVIVKKDETDYSAISDYDVELLELIAVKDRYLFTRANIDKYREFMSLMDVNFLEYCNTTDSIKIYNYFDRRSNVIVDASLDELSENVRNNPKLTDKEREEFLEFSDALIYSKNHIKLELNGSAIIPGDTHRYKVRLNSYSSDYSEGIIAGVLIETDDKVEKTNDDQFLSESFFDPGTGLLNKRGIRKTIEDRMRACDKVFYIALVDVDDFKKINDTHGHLFGDKVLSQIAKLLTTYVDTRGVAGRFGGDEFMIILDRADNYDEVERILKMVVEGVKSDFEGVGECKVTLSIGAAQYPHDGAEYDSLFVKADKAVYIAKSLGKDRCIIYDDAIHGSIVKVEGNSLSVGLGRRSLFDFKEKSYIVSDLILEINEQKEAALPHVFETMRYYFDIDGCVAYKGDKLKRVTYLGNFKKPFDNLGCINDPEYSMYFEEHGWCEISRIMKLERCKEAFDGYTAQETGKIMQCKYPVNGDAKAVVSFECFNRAPKYSAEDLGLIRIVGRTIVQMLCND